MCYLPFKNSQVEFTFMQRFIAYLVEMGADLKRVEYKNKNSLVNQKVEIKFSSNDVCHFHIYASYI